ncbi:MAG TPA: nitrilase family protein [Puia sp.]
MSTLTITTIQADLRWEDKAANLQRFEEKIHGIRENTEIVVLPEMFSTGFSMKPEMLAERMDGPTLDWMKKVAAQKKIILTGSLIIEEGGHYFNRLIWMLPNGQYGYYDKRHRFAYAGEDEHYTAGKKRLIASVKGWKVNLLVCYDLRFPVWSRQTSGVSQDPVSGTSLIPGHPAAAAVAPESPEYDLLIYVANWPERRSLAWKTLLQARAIENQSYVIGVNRVGEDGNKIDHSGDSMIIDPLGEVLYHGLKEEAIYTYTLRKEKLEEVRSRFPFWRDADHFSIEP